MRVTFLLLVASCAGHTVWANAVEVDEHASHEILITAGRRGFEPNETHARAGEVVSLVFTRTEVSRCVERVRVYLDDHRRIERALPLGQPVRVTLRLLRAGEVGISCAMQTFGATLRVDP